MGLAANLYYGFMRLFGVQRPGRILANAFAVEAENPGNATRERVLIAIGNTCPGCGGALATHRISLLATLPWTNDHAIAVRELVEQESWDELALTAGEARVAPPTIDVFAIDCPHQGRPTVVTLGRPDDPLLSDQLLGTHRVSAQEPLDRARIASRER
ncbi:MAG: hypothetical protein ACYC60_18640 [Thermoanaerobaculia bacterium]